MRSLFQRVESLCEGAIVVDRDAKIVWLNDKYAGALGLRGAADAVGRDVEEVIPNSRMREVVATGAPILLDIMTFGSQSFVVTRMPLEDDRAHVIGGVGFVLYDRLHALRPLVARFAELQSELMARRKQATSERRPRYTFDSIVGKCAASQDLKRQARRAAGADTNVLLLGETGTGKEMLAHAIHAASIRGEKPFIGVNMAAMPEGLLEAEFFGAAPGAYTGARNKSRDGRFKLADGGTLFLDEIGDMPLALQPKLLRALQEQEIEPLGSNTVFRVDVRLIAATSVDLGKLVAQGRFRADLYFRLNVFPIQIPPLRDRLDDLEDLAGAFLDSIAERSGLPLRTLTPSALVALGTHDWPGNVRELRNVLEQALLRSDNRRLTADDFATIIPKRAGQAFERCDTFPIEKYADELVAFEARVFENALRATSGRVADAAKRLGISRASLYKKLGRLALSRNGDRRLRSKTDEIS